MRKLFALAAIAAASLFATPAVAQAVPVSTLTGVNVGGTSYNVDFVGGSCTGLFGGCTNLTFTTQANADTAATALLNALTGTDPSTVANCAAATRCDIYIPYTNLGANVGAAAASLRTIGSTTFNNTFDINGNLGSGVYVGTVYARFTAAIPAAVPEPATWALMLLGFGAIGIATRRKHTGALVTA